MIAQQLFIFGFLLLVISAVGIFSLRIPQRRIRNWWRWYKYGICPIHLTLAAAGGGYEPKWTCKECERENRIKNEDRVRWRADERIRIKDQMVQEFLEQANKNGKQTVPGRF